MKIKYLLIVAAVLLAAFILTGLTRQRDKAFKSVDVEEFASVLSDTSFVLLDVRTPAEYAEGHIPGTHYNIDVLDGNFERLAEKFLPKDKSVALYCRSGNRSKDAAEILAAKGFNVVELSSGFKGWSGAGMPVEK